jgi:hypothetical protein
MEHRDDGRKGKHTYRRDEKFIDQSTPQGMMKG